MIRPLAFLLALSAPAAAQAPDPGTPAFDDTIQPACLAAHEGAGARMACIGQAAHACMTAADENSTLVMVECMGAEVAQWDGNLNTAYQSLMQTAQREDGAVAVTPSRVDLLRDSQRHWIAYRDASCNWLAAGFDGGTGGRLAGTSCLLDLTARQALWLMQLEQGS